MKEIKNDTNRLRDMSCSLIGRISIMKMTILPKTIYIINVVPIRFPMAFFKESGRKNLQSVWRHNKS